MPDINNQSEYALYQQTVAQFITDEGLSFLSTGCSPDLSSDEYERDYEPWFSWQPCEMCQCSLGGNREYLFARDTNNDIVRFTICEDCVYYVEYGRLDDQTMTRVSSAATSTAQHSR